MIRSTKCKFCKKYLGESFRDFPEGIVDDGTDYWCSDKCYKTNNGYGIPPKDAQKIINREREDTESLVYTWKDVVFAYKLGTHFHGRSS